MSVIKKLNLCEFTLWGRDLVTVVRIESPYYRGFFLKKMYENFVGTLEAARNGEVSVLERCTYREVRLSLSPPQRLPLGIPIKISIIDKNRKRYLPPSHRAPRPLFFFLPSLPTTQHKSIPTIQRGLCGGESDCLIFAGL